MGRRRGDLQHRLVSFLPCPEKRGVREASRDWEGDFGAQSATLSSHDEVASLPSLLSRPPKARMERERERESERERRERERESQLYELSPCCVDSTPQLQRNSLSFPPSPQPPQKNSQKKEELHFLRHQKSSHGTF